MIGRIRRVLTSLGCCGVVLAALSLSARAEACRNPSTPFFQELAAVTKDCRHPLCGRVLKLPLSAETGTCAADAFNEALATTLQSKGVIILGETHDNGAQHRLQAAIVRQFALTSKPPSVVFEQMRDDQQAGLDAFHALGSKGTLKDLMRLIDWDKSGWPKDAYNPLLAAVVDDHLAISPGDVPHAGIMKAAKEGEGSLPLETRQRIGLATPLGPSLDAASVKDIEAAHCGVLPKEAFAGMAYAQRYRDAHLADAALRAGDIGGGAILIAGTGHARTDRGVPWYVRQREPSRAVLSIMLIEVDDGQAVADAYVDRDPDGKPAADYLIFTPRADHGDPCAKMRAMKVPAK